MPFYLRDRDLSSEISGIGSVLIVPCRFCPAASLAVREKKPFMRLFQSFPRTAGYEEYIGRLKSGLEEAGIKARVFDSRLPHHLVVCMWTAGRRQQLRRCASQYDAVVVLGCGAAVRTAQECVPSTGCRVIPAMEVEGIMNVIPSFQFPGDISLELSSLIQVRQDPEQFAGTRPERLIYIEADNRVSAD